MMDKYEDLYSQLVFIRGTVKHQLQDLEKLRGERDKARDERNNFEADKMNLTIKVEALHKVIDRQRTSFNFGRVMFLGEQLGKQANKIRSLQEDNRRLQFMIDNGLDEDDMFYDIQEIT